MKRGTALLAALLAACQAPAQVTAFTSPGALCSRGQQQRRSALSSTSDAGRGNSAAAGKLTAAAGPARAREIAAQARRRARDARSRVRDTLPRSNMQGTVQAPPAPRETTARAPRTTSPPSPPPPLPPPPPPPPLTRQPGRQPRRSSRVSPSRDGRRTRPDSGIAGAKATAAAAAAAAAARKRRRVTDPPPPPPPPSVSSSEELDALQRRVKEILDEYCSKAPLPEEQWPPGRRIRVRGVEIFYKDTGSRSRAGARSTRRDRPTFVLLHGLAGSTASWDEVIGDLSEYGRVISFDRPGFGRTERVMPPAVAGLPSWRLCAKTMGENPYSADFAAKALFGVLDRLGVDKVIVVAHSLGAQVALRAARARPGTVRALALVAPAVLNPLDSKFVMGRDPNANLFSAILNLRTRVEMTAKLAAFNLQLLQPGEAPLHAVRNMTLNGDVEERVQQNFHDRSITLGRPELVAKYIEPLRDPLWDRGLLHFYKSLQGEVQPGEQLLQNTLDVWKGPSMIITGDDDPTVPTQSSIYVAEAMEGRLVVIESCAHIPMDEKSEVFASAVLSFANSEEVEDAWQADGDSAKSWW